MSNLSTAIALQEVLKEVVSSDEVMIHAAAIAQEAGMSNEILELLFKYTAVLSASVATEVVRIVMPISEFNLMMKDIKEFEKMGEEIV